MIAEKEECRPAEGCGDLNCVVCYNFEFEFGVTDVKNGKYAALLEKRSEQKQNSETPIPP